MSVSAEISALIAAQDRDSRSYRVFSVSTDALGLNLFEKPRRLTASDDRHGTLYCYVRLGCRCDKCRVASAEQKRVERRRNHALKRPYTYRLCCQNCGSEAVRRERVYG